MHFQGGKNYFSFGEFRPFIQGILGDCWLLSTCAAVAKREDLLHKVVPPDQVKNAAW